MSTNELKMVKGSCLCKAVSYSLSGAYINSALCHCVNCQKASGSAFGSNAVYNLSQFSIMQGAEQVREYKDSDTTSGNTLLRHFCSQCGSPLYILNPTRPGIVVVTSGAMETKDHYKPKQEYYTKDRRVWLDETEGVQAFEGARTA